MEYFRNEVFLSFTDDDKLHLTLRQTYDSKYADQKTPAYQILSGNFKKDVSTDLLLYNHDKILCCTLQVSVHKLNSDLLFLIIFTP